MTLHKDISNVIYSLRRFYLSVTKDVTVRVARRLTEYIHNSNLGDGILTVMSKKLMGLPINFLFFKILVMFYRDNCINN